MKKKLFFAFLPLLAMALSLVSCSDSDPGQGAGSGTDGGSSKEMADYTVIFWGMAGGLDDFTSRDLATLASNYQKKLIGKNVNFMGLVKTSMSHGMSNVDPSLDKTLYFDTDTINPTAVDNSVEPSKTGEGYLSYCQEKYNYALKTLNGREYAGTDYPLNNVDSLANFIKKAAEKFPARHYVLMAFGHGGGFSPVKDVPSTRACVFDSFNEGKGLAADDIVDAVKESGVKMQTLFTQCCLMATLENMAAYSQVFDYGILSAEVTDGGYFPEYLKKISEAGDNEEKLQTKSRELVDYYVDVATASYVDPENADSYTSHGFYDLRKMSQLTPILQEAAEWYAANYADTQLQYGIETALNSSVSCVNIGMESSTYYTYRKYLQDIIKKEYSSPDELPMEELEQLYTGIYCYLEQSHYVFGYGFCMSDVLRQTSLSEDLPAEKRAEIKAIYDRYLTQLKDMAYIRTTMKPKNADANYEYIYASPSVNLFAMNEEYFVPLLQGGREKLNEMLDALEQKDYDTAEQLSKQLFEGSYFANSITLENVEYNYTSSVFDKQVKWSNFLKLLKVNPSIVFNPDRMQITLDMLN